MSDVLTAEVGQPFTVELGSAPSTGYMWELAELPPGMELLDRRFQIAAAAAIGDGGLQRFDLRAATAGTWQLRFVLKRRWEHEPVQQRELRVEVR